VRTRLKPTPGILIIVPMAEETRTASGLHLPLARETSTNIGIVEAVCPPAGEAAEDYFKPGDHVVIGKWAGHEVTIQHTDGTRKRFIIVNEDSILATLEEEETSGNVS
jgi:co-chaperonin GroES (HSP10)